MWHLKCLWLRRLPSSGMWHTSFNLRVRDTDRNVGKFIPDYTVNILADRTIFCITRFNIFQFLYMGKGSCGRPETSGFISSVNSWNPSKTKAAKSFCSIFTEKRLSAFRKRFPSMLPVMSRISCALVFHCETVPQHHLAHPFHLQFCIFQED